MNEEQFALLRLIVKEYQDKYQDSSISLHPETIDVRVGSKRGYKNKVLRAKIIKEQGVDPGEKQFFDFKVVYFNNHITITDAYWAFNILTCILLDFTKTLNHFYRRENE